MAPRAVLMKTGLRLINTVRPVNIAHPKTTVYSARPMLCFSKSAQSTVKRPYQLRTALTNKNFSQKVNTAKGKFYTARPKVVNTARPNSTVVNVVKANQVNAVKASACWGHPQKEDQGYVDWSKGARHPKHPSYHALSDDDIQVEDQPYADDASPTAESPRHITDSKSIEEDFIDYPDEPEDEDEDLEEDPEEDPEEDHID
ncbi:hypothetical protein Tco_0949669 [Tanacetum coccineum]